MSEQNLFASSGETPIVPENSQSGNLMGLPDDMASNPEVVAAVQRAIERANQDFADPELQQLPMPRMPQPEAVVDPPKRAVLGSRARHDVAISSSQAAPIPVSPMNAWPFAVGRSPAAAKRQRELDEIDIKRQRRTGR